ncbi:MAG: hypothetical protein KC652_04770 [Cyanobacteria bacterium HKST-UBA01]|nr:hypothetical protein [Cyanobacteria bacterium HKST-UBA01]
MKYAYHFYLRKMIPIGVIQKAPFENAPYSIPKMPLSRLAAGSDKGLDLVCEGILNPERQFVFESEQKYLA